MRSPRFFLVMLGALAMAGAFPRLAAADAASPGLGLGNASPGTLVVEVTPSHVRLHDGGTATFAAVARDQSGSEMQGTVTWRVIPDRIGHIDATGNFVADRAGRGVVRATFVAGQQVGYGHAMVTVSMVQEMLELEVTPHRAMVAPGESHDFNVRLARGLKGTLDMAAVQWTVDPPSLGTIASDGHFIAGNAVGQGRVEARAVVDGKTLTGSAVVDVGVRTGNAALRVEIAPRRVTAAPGAQVTFTATVYGPDGPITDPDITWEVSPAGLGMITPDGMLTIAKATGQALNNTGSPRAGEVFARVRWHDRMAVGTASVSVERDGDSGFSNGPGVGTGKGTDKGGSNGGQPSTNGATTGPGKHDTHTTSNH